MFLTRQVTLRPSFKIFASLRTFFRFGRGIIGLILIPHTLTLKYGWSTAIPLSGSSEAAGSREITEEEEKGTTSALLVGLVDLKHWQHGAKPERLG
jgi:hypothetical protein